MSAPTKPKIYHIVHVDRLPSIIADSGLWCDAEIAKRHSSCIGGTIGIETIKQRRLNKMLHSHPDLHVGDCVPFYFCPRSVMLYVIHKGNDPDLAYRGVQDPIIHLEADLYETVEWAHQNNKRWAFTLSNAGSMYFKDRCDLNDLNDIDWEAVQSRNWSKCKEAKQAEFLVEHSFPLELILRIGTYSEQVYRRVCENLRGSALRVPVERRPEWYY